MKRSTLSWVYGLSVVAHASLAMGVSSVPEPSRTVTHRVSIVVADPPPPPETPEVEPEPEPEIAPEPEVVPAKVAKAAPTPPPAAPPEAAKPAAANATASDVPDFGVAMTGGGGPGGIAVPVGNPRADPNAPREKKVVAPKVLEAAPVRAAAAACSDPETKPKALSLPQPSYTDAARQAGVEGKVRVAITVDEQGNVVDVKILQPLDPGLDAAALESAKAARFEPATRCGSPIAATFTVSIRFTL